MLIFEKTLNILNIFNHIFGKYFESQKEDTSTRLAHFIQVQRLHDIITYYVFRVLAHLKKDKIVYVLRCV